MTNSNENLVAIATECNRRLSIGLEMIALTRPGPPPRCRRVRLAGRNSPLGEVANWTEDRGLVAYYPALDVLAWCIAHGALPTEPPR